MALAIKNLNKNESIQVDLNYETIVIQNIRLGFCYEKGSLKIP